MAEYKLMAIHSATITDFYGTATVRVSGTTKELYDGKDKIAVINGIKAKILVRHLSEWQIEEVKEFLRQDHFEVGGLTLWQLKNKYK